MTQKEKIIEKLELDGFVSNFWSIENYMLRLGAIICELRKEGWVFETKFGKGNERKNYYYHLKLRPPRTLFDGKQFSPTQRKGQTEVQKKENHFSVQKQAR